MEIFGTPVRKLNWLSSLLRQLVSVGLVIAIWSGLTSALGQVIKIGVINSFTGPLVADGTQIGNGIKLYLEQHSKDLPAGVKVELIWQDDEGRPEVAKGAAQKLISQDRIQILTGVTSSLSAKAIAPVAGEAKVPFLVIDAPDPSVAYLSPYVLRFSTTLAQEATPLARWGAYRGFKTSYAAATDNAFGNMTATTFSKSFSGAGGKYFGTEFWTSWTNPDRASRVSELTSKLTQIGQAKPDLVLISVPGGEPTREALQAWGKLALKSTGINLAAMPEMLLDDILPTYGDEVLGVFSSGSYSAAATRPQNKSYVEAYKHSYGNKAIPNEVSVQAWDGMAAIYDLLKQTNGKFTGDQAMEILANYRSVDSPRGPIRIDPKTRNLVATIYMRRVEKHDGQLQNTEFQQFAAVNSDGTGGGGDPCDLGQCRCPDRTCKAECCNK